MDALESAALPLTFGPGTAEMHVAYTLMLGGLSCCRWSCTVFPRRTRSSWFVKVQRSFETDYESKTCVKVQQHRFDQVKVFSMRKYGVNNANNNIIYCNSQVLTQSGATIGRAGLPKT